MLPIQTRAMTIAGRVLSALAIGFLLMDGGMKLAAPPFVIEATAALGWPATAETVRGLGAVLLLAALLHLWPRTALLGALGITAYLGGAVATHVRIGSPLATHILFGVYLGLILWAGYWLRAPRLRALFPLAAQG